MPPSLVVEHLPGGEGPLARVGIKEMIQCRRFGIFLGHLAAQCLDELLGHLDEGDSHAIATLEAPVLGRRQYYQSIIGRGG